MTNNPLNVPSTELLDYAAVKAEHVKEMIETLLPKAKANIDAYIARLKDKEEITWAEYSEHDEDSTRMWRAWGVAHHFQSVVSTPEMRAVTEKFLPVLSEFSTSLGLNEDLYKITQKVAARTDLDSVQRRIVDLAIHGFKTSGVGLQGKEKEAFITLSQRLGELGQKFGNNDLDATDEWFLDITDKARLEGLPEDAIEAARKLAEEKGVEGWRFTLHMPSYLPVMQYAKDGALREAVYRGYSTVASDQGNAKYDNGPIMAELLKKRRELAQLLSYSSYPAYALEDRMADSEEQVMHFLRDLAAKSKPQAEQEHAEMKAFADQELGIEDMKSWDGAFVSEHMREARFNYSENEVRQYLPEPKVTEGLEKLLNRLYGIRFVPVQLSAWHPDVKTYEVHDERGIRGYLYMDLFARPGKQSGAWVNGARNRHLLNGEVVLPITTLTCNFAAPTDKKPSLLTFDDVITLFHETGHAMHHLLTQVDYTEVSWNAVEWDAIELPSQFMENFAYMPSVMEEISGHWETGAPLPAELQEKIIAAKNFNSALGMLRQIEFALFDMIIHSRETIEQYNDILKALDEVRDEVAVSKPPAWNRFPNSFGHIFAGGYSAGYYSYKWAEVLSADAFAAFEEDSSCDPDKNRALGLKFRDEVLAIGGKRPAKEFFQAFRGREPQVDALLRHSGIRVQ